MMGIGRMLMLALLAIAASLTLRLDAVLAAVDIAALMPGGGATAGAATVAQMEPSRATVALREKDPAVDGDDLADIEAALMAATSAPQTGRPDPAVTGVAGESMPTAAPPPSAEPRMLQLTKMYSAMRPKDAARIFERLDLPVQVEVALAMKERSMAAILAEMRPETASDLMMALAGSPRRRAAPPE